MNQQDAGRLAIGVFLGAVGAVAITKSGLSPPEYVWRWLLYTLVTGVLINTQEGKGIPYLLAAAVLSALSLVATVLWIGLLGGGVSGIKVDNRPLFATAFLCGLWFVSALAVFVCAFSRSVMLGLLHNVISLDLDKAKKIETLLRVLTSSIGIVALLIL